MDIITQEVADTRAKIARIGALLFERQLTDAGGGNISVRVGDLVCITPRYSGSKYQWHLKPEDVLVADLDQNILAGTGQISREAKAHFSLYHNYSDYGSSVIHCHARHLLVFAALNRPMPPILEATRKFGVTPVVGYGTAHTKTLANNVVESIRGREKLISNHAVAALAPWHGVFVMGKDLDATFDAVERLDTNAYCIIMGGLLHNPEALAAQRDEMEAVIGNFKEE